MNQDVILCVRWDQLFQYCYLPINRQDFLIININLIPASYLMNSVTFPVSKSILTVSLTWISGWGYLIVLESFVTI